MSLSRAQGEPTSFHTSVKEPGSSSLVIRLAKSEIRLVHVWQALENPLYQRAGPRDNDFASRIAFGDGGAVAGAVSSEGFILPIASNRSIARIILCVGTPSTHT
jgi:hypothetical protein